MIGIPIAVLGVSFASAVATVANRRYNKLGRRKVAVTKNMIVIDGLSAYFPERRGDLSSTVIGEIRSKTGFSDEEIFRKYLRFFLDKRELNRETVSDVIALRSVCNLDARSFFRVLSESAERYEREGTDRSHHTIDSSFRHICVCVRESVCVCLICADTFSVARDDRFRMYVVAGLRSATVF